MNTKPLCTLTALLTFVSAGAHASSTDVNISGTLTPAACTPSLSANGQVDFGNISMPELPPQPVIPDHSALPPRNLTFTVVCDRPTRFALIATGNRRDSTSMPMPKAFGLGTTTSGESLGFYSAVWADSDATLDNLPADTLYSEDKGSTWTRIAGGGFEHQGDKPDSRLGFARRSQNSPSAAELLNLRLEVTGWLRNDITHVDEALLDGHMTIELQYL
ncbi:MULTISPECIES: DUF1120 domain-containing protein [Pseudomonas]|uniref:DUF1120 domain-containing protein n=1 Tax=Pseudomonas donghuensis TaxID=1163398 RepID=A0AAP0SN59_9PSED|nr:MULTISPECIES: DUF1120 domain-containing protein [Pseudomonas]MDF9892367.1 hypothetical protein [Pseudomonas vranovensis]KDO01830.1 DUF1120 domain-containing protein [Pseudomonas donghuensis]MBS7600025.1 DUF1120 domain-containing protein [Pseudomonas sp. RC2C2]MCP6694419.1 DUF1120 domain-containing protein [Pseudomonas donghuensis]QHF27594.1 hypothetical protein PspR32_07145 [Pseudomonas sp. R32]